MPLHVPMHIDFSGTVSDVRFFRTGEEEREECGREGEGQGEKRKKEALLQWTASIRT